MDTGDIIALAALVLTVGHICWEVWDRNRQRDLELQRNTPKLALSNYFKVIDESFLVARVTNVGQCSVRIDKVVAWASLQGERGTQGFSGELLPLTESGGRSNRELPVLLEPHQSREFVVPLASGLEVLAKFPAPSLAVLCGNKRVATEPIRGLAEFLGEVTNK